MSLDAMTTCKMTVFRPERRAHYVMRWVDPRTRRRCEKSTGQTRKREAYTVAMQCAAEVMAGRAVGRIEWDDFCDRYERLVNDHRHGRAREPWITVRNWIKAYGPPRFLDEITTAWVTEWQAWLHRQVHRTNAKTKRQLTPNTIAGHSARLRAAMRWAVQQELIARAPIVRVAIEETPRSRGITVEEFERILDAVPKVRPHDAAKWKRLLRGLWHSGFRISEVVGLSWDAGAPIHLEASGRYPVVSLAPRSNKSRRRRVRPISPEFWQVCCETPPDQRQGLVFPIPNNKGGQMTIKRIVRNISAIGHQAGIVTNPETGKLATSHDARRGFVNRMDGPLTPAELQKWMGHASIQTTMSYYHTKDAQQLAAKVWERKTESGGASGGAADSGAISSVQDD